MKTFIKKFLWIVVFVAIITLVWFQIAFFVKMNTVDEYIDYVFVDQANNTVSFGIHNGDYYVYKVSGERCSLDFDHSGVAGTTDK